MFKGSVLFLIVPFLLVANGKMDFPYVEKNKPQLGKTLFQVVRKVHPDFHILTKNSFTAEVNKNSNNHPMTIVGDFNGDGHNDAAFYGYSMRERKFYTYASIAVPKKNTFKLFKINERAFMDKQSFRGFTTYLTLGQHENISGAKRDILQVETFSPELMLVESYFYSLYHKRFASFHGTMD